MSMFPRRNLSELVIDFGHAGGTGGGTGGTLLLWQIVSYLYVLVYWTVRIPFGAPSPYQ